MKLSSCLDDREGNCVTPFTFNPKIQPGYHWHRLGIGRVTRSCEVFVSVQLCWFLGQNYIECDGMDEDPNWYEMWISVKWDADPNTTDMTRGFFLDRLVLRRVKKPDGK